MVQMLIARFLPMPASKPVSVRPPRPPPVPAVILHAQPALFHSPEELQGFSQPVLLSRCCRVADLRNGGSSPPGTPPGGLDPYSSLSDASLVV